MADADGANVVRQLATGRCPAHRRYAKKRQPRSLCQNCWFLWFLQCLADKTLEFNFIDSEGKHG